MIELRRILVPLDGSELSERALPIAAAIAEKFNSEMLLLRVLDVPVPASGTKYPEDLWTWEAQQFGHREVRGYLTQHQTGLVDQGIATRIIVRDDSPAEDILDVAVKEDVDLIVMSSHGKGGSSQWTSGSVADKVMQHSVCPVLVVRENPVAHKQERMTVVAATAW